jgi:Holin of 3TMs, for gene-transfer release
MPLLDVLTSVFKPITDLIEHVVPSGDAKVQLQQKVLEGQITVAMQGMEYERQLLDAQSRIILAEAQGNSWLQRNWRPITALTLLGLVVCDSYGWLPNRLADEAWTLLQIVLGGYVAGRSIEKTAPAIVNAIAQTRKP